MRKVLVWSHAQGLQPDAQDEKEHRMSHLTPPVVTPDLERGQAKISSLREEGYEWKSLPLLVHHANYLRARGVAAFVAGTRGYVSCGEGTGYRDVLPDTATGWSPEQRALILGQAELAPADAPAKPGRPSKAAKSAAEARRKNATSLLLPMYSGVGARTPVIWQARPDFPRVVDGKPLKFEQPAGAARGSDVGSIPVDVHPRVHDLVWESYDREGGEWVGETPILLTEGVLKADATLSAALREGLDLAPVSVPGVTMPFYAPASAYNPQSPNRGTSPILTEAMLDLPWDGRIVYLCWDADWLYNEGVSAPLLATARLLEDEGAEVYVLSVPMVGGDHKTGVDDYLADATRRGLTAPLADLLNAAISLDEAEFLTHRYTNDDIGRSDRLAEHTARYDLGIYSPMHKSWMAYDAEQGIWTVDTSGNAIQEVAKALTAYDLYGDETHATRTATSVVNTVKLARSHPLLQVGADDFNRAATHVLNVANGIVDLRTGELSPHDAKRRFTRVAPVEYDADAFRRHAEGEGWSTVIPEWIATLDFIFYGDADLIRTIQRTLGMSLLGEVAGGPGMSWWVSGGSSGKSTITTVLLDMLGIDELTGYATLLDHDALTRESTPEMRATLFGKRLLVFQEFPAGTRLNDGDLKKLTSDDVLKARLLYGNPFSFKPTHNTIAATNHLPRIATTERGTWRRLKRVDFPRTITDAEKDLGLGERLRGEYPGILAWLVEGCIDYLREGNYWAPSVLEATEQWRTSGDALAAVLGCIEVSPNRSRDGVSDEDLYALYRDLVDDDSSGYRSRAAFLRALEVHQDFPPNSGRVETARRVRYRNLRLTATGEERVRGRQF